MHNPTIRSPRKHEKLWIFVGTMILAVLAPVGTQASCTSFDGHLEWVGGLGGGTFVDAYDVAVSGTTAYLRDYRNGMSLYDISNPASPVSLGYIGLHGKGYSVTVSGTHVYAASGSSGTTGYFEVVDVSNPASPILQASIHIPGWGVDVEVSGNFAYVVEGTGALRVIDVSTPTLPVIVGNLALPGNTSSNIALLGSVAYVANATTGIVVVDISTPTNPVILRSMDIPGWSSQLAASGTRLYVTNPYGDPWGPSGLQVLDVSNPSSPTILGSLITTNAGSIAVSGTTAYTASGLQLKAIDVSNPASPAIMDSIGLSDWAGGLALSGKLICLADGSSGLQLIEHCTNGVVPVALSNFQAVPEPGAIDLRWATSLDSDLAGFHVFRSVPAGAFQRITASLLPAPGPYSFRDESVLPGQSYAYRLEAFDRGGGTTFFGPYLATAGLSQNRLGFNRPNPFHAGRGSTRIDFDIAHSGRAILRILDISGSQVRVLVDDYLPAGSHRVIWDGRDENGQPAVSGTYFYQLVSGRFSKTERLVVTQ